MNINEEYNVEILRENNEGDGVASVNGFIVFVKGALKNEKVKIKIDEVNKNYAVGSIIEIKEKVLIEEYQYAHIFMIVVDVI